MNLNKEQSESTVEASRSSEASMNGALKSPLKKPENMKVREYDPLLYIFKQVRIEICSSRCWLGGVMVALLTPDQTVAGSIPVRVSLFFTLFQAASP